VTITIVRLVFHLSYHSCVVDDQMFWWSVELHLNYCFKEERKKNRCKDSNGNWPNKWSWHHCLSQ